MENLPLDYKPFAAARVGVFQVHDTDKEYTLPGGWSQKIEEHKIIGETTDHFITRLLPSTIGYWIKGKVVEYSYTSTIGLHKSRLVKWHPYQLTLF